jgi:hypothetical protein
MKSKILSIFLVLTVLGGVAACAPKMEEDVVDVRADSRETEEQAEEVYYSGEPTNIEVFNYEFREDVTVIDEAPAYSIVETDDTFIITVHNPNDEIKSLSVGDTFAFEPTEQNISGAAGHIISLADEGAVLVITAKIPQSLDEIFDEFEFIGDINILAETVEIELAEELQGIDGIVISRNPRSFVGIDFGDVKLGDMTISGGIKVYQPRMSVALFSPAEDNISVTLEMETNIKVSIGAKIDEFFPLVYIHAGLFGIGTSIGIGIRFNAEGTANVEYIYAVAANFGYKNAEEFVGINEEHTLNFFIEGKVEISANVRAGLRVLFIPIWGVQADLGKGGKARVEMLATKCAEDCIIVGIYDIVRISSLDDWGILKFLRFAVYFTDEEATSYRFYSDGEWLDKCPHNVIVEEPPEPEAEPYEINNIGVYGNTAGNIIFGGIAAIYGDWIYYQNFNDKNSLYKIHINGTGNQKLNDNGVKYINVVDGWIYYCNMSDRGSIYKIRIDGSEETMVSDDRFSINVTVVDDWIYYIYSEDGPLVSCNIYKIRTDGTERTKLNNDYSRYMHVVGDWVYYRSTGPNTNSFNRVRTDGTERTVLFNFTSPIMNLIVANDMIFYHSNNGINIARIDGTENITLIDDNFIIAVIDDWIYYGAYDGLYKSRIDGSEKIKIIDESNNPFNYINVVGDWSLFITNLLLQLF